MGVVDLSIIIPAWNAEATIGECLDSVMAQRTSRRFEVIVVDSSSDGTADVVRRYSRVKLIKLKKRTFSGAARNIGISESNGDVVFFLDADAIAGPNWIEEMMVWHSKDDCAAVAGAIVNGNPESLVSWASYMTEFGEYFPIGKPRYQLVGATANLSYKRWALEKFGGFSPCLKQYVDTEFNCRLNAGGDKLLFIPDIPVKHKHRTTLRDYLRHETNRGRCAIAVRRQGFLPHNSVTRSRWLCVLASGPVLVRLICRDTLLLIRTHMLPWWRILAVLPISVTGLLAWTFGFISEAVSPRICLSGIHESSSQKEAVHT